MRQEVTRAHASKGWALDGVAMVNDITRYTKEEITQPPPADMGKKITEIFLLLKINCLIFTNKIYSVHRRCVCLWLILGWSRLG